MLSSLVVLKNHKLLKLRKGYYTGEERHIVDTP